jgi:hypothetical protein
VTPVRWCLLLTLAGCGHGSTATDGPREAGPAADGNSEGDALDAPATQDAGGDGDAAAEAALDGAELPDVGDAAARPDRAPFEAGALCDNSAVAGPCFAGEQCEYAPCQQSNAPRFCVCVADHFDCVACMTNPFGPAPVEDCPADASGMGCGAGSPSEAIGSPCAIRSDAGTRYCACRARPAAPPIWVCD